MLSDVRVFVDNQKAQLFPKVMRSLSWQLAASKMLCLGKLCDVFDCFKCTRPWVRDVQESVSAIPGRAQAKAIEKWNRS